LGRVPQDGDDVALAGYVIVWDTAQTRIPATGTLTSITSTGTAGQITLALDNAAFHGGASLYATTIQAGTATALVVTGTTDHVLTITCGTGTGEGCKGGAGVGQDAIGVNSTGTVNVVGKLVGGTGVSSCGLNKYTAATGVITVSGGCFGGASGTTNSGLRVTVEATITVSGGATGTAGGQGVYLNAAGTPTISVSGDIAGGSGNAAHNGIFCSANAQVTISSTSNLINGTGAVAYSGPSPAWQPASTSYIKMYVGASFGQAANTEFPQVLAAENIKSGVTSGSVVGTLIQTVKTLFSILTPSGWQKGI
jgi:hypothetical protein